MEKSLKNRNDPDSSKEESARQDVSPLIEAFRMLSHITTAIVLTMICGGLGYVVDRYLDIKGVTVIGFLAGGAWALRQLIIAISR